MVQRNLGGKMEKRINRPEMITSIIAVGNILAWILNMIVGGGSVRGLFLSGGGYAKEFGEASFSSVMIRGEWWRLLTCGYLHMGVFHLLFNLYALFLVGNKVEKYLGHFRFFLLYHTGTAITAFLWCFLFRNGSMVGASLGIYASLGMYAVSARADREKKSSRINKGQRNYLILYVLIGCLLGIGTIAVHFIGFVVGMVAGWLFARQKSDHLADQSQNAP